MDFAAAETYLNISLLFHKPSIFLVGSNGIGKTALLEAMASHFKRRTFSIAGIDFGGLQTIGEDLKREKIRTVVVSDMQVILMRKPGVKTQTLGLLSSLISEGMQNQLTYGNENATKLALVNRMKKMKIHPFNFIIAGTAEHLNELILMHQYDFLNRMVIIQVTRDNKDFTPERFTLPNAPITKITPEQAQAYKSYMNQPFAGLSQRHNIFVNMIMKAAAALGIDGKKLINSTNPQLFEPLELPGKHVNVSNYLKVIKIP